MSRGIAAAVVGLILLAAWVDARPGGGQSYSGGSSSSSSSGSSSSGSSGRSSSDWSSGSGSSSGGGISFGSSGSEVLDFFIFVIVVFGGIIVFGLLREKITGEPMGYDIGGSSDLTPVSRDADRDEVFTAVKEVDPDFSLVLFEDFVFTLFAEAHRARHDAGALAGLAPYLSPKTSASLAARRGRVEAVAVGALSFRSVERKGGYVEVVLAVDANLHTALPGGPVTQYVVERWTLRRSLEARTKAVKGLRKLGCPQCGAPFRPGGDGRCEACGSVVADGRFDWMVAATDVETEEARPHSFTGHADEVGTDASTLFQPFAMRRRRELTEADPGVTNESLEARLRLIAATLFQAWADQDLWAARPFLSERLVAYMQYWLDAYKAQGLRNAVNDPRIERVLVVRVERDAHYDAVVLRFWATGYDFTEEVATRRVVGGSTTVPRRYSEYWTLIRSASVRGVPRTDKACPACGAPLDVNMAGECAHCRVHLTSGEFDWVLSKIEQDEAYRG